MNNLTLEEQEFLDRLKRRIAAQEKVNAQRKPFRGLLSRIGFRDAPL
ncbi:MAG: hypothetical protein AAF826_12075 [Pseudomonadota bacterium]